MAVPAKIMQLTIPENKRIICISDVHGQLDIFKRLLGKVKFCDDDILILLGDICLGRHDNSQISHTLEFVMTLCKRPNVYALRGSWECAERLPKNCDDAIKKLAATWFDSLPHIIETPSFVFVHAGISSNNLSEQDAHSCMLHLPDDVVFEKIVVAGHCPTLNHSKKILSCNPIINMERRVILIDGGLDTWGVGQLNALFIENGVFSYQSADSLPVMVAPTAQKASGSDLSIVWVGGGEVELVKAGDEFSLYKHLRSGKIIELANMSVDVMENDAQGGEKSSYLRCSLGTDYHLPVAAGDEITVLHRFSDRIYAKKDGVIGFYRTSAL